MVRSVWHRTFFVMLAVCAVAVIASFHLRPDTAQAPSADTGAGASSTAAVRTADHAAPTCRSADLSADYRARDSAAGHRYGVIRLRNTSDRTCVLQGYGELSYVGGGDGTEFGAPADREPGVIRQVVLAPGERALSRVTETLAQNYPRSTCRPSGVDAFLVYPPDGKRPFFVMHPTTGCLNESVHLISHKPFHG